MAAVDLCQSLVQLASGSALQLDEVKTRPLGRLMWALEWPRKPSRLEIARAFGAYLGSNPDADIADIEVQIRSETKSFSPFAFVRLVNVWNEMTDEKVDIEPFVQSMRLYYLESVDAMERFVKDSARLGKVFRSEWFTALHDDLEAWSGAGEYTTNRFGAFVSFRQFGCGEGSLLKQLDEGFVAVGEKTGRKLSHKLRAMQGSLDDYVSIGFEILVLSKFPRIVEYEPRISSGRPEARVELAGQTVLIEARATMDIEPVNGPFWPEDIGNFLAAKAKEKYKGQLRGAEEPVILFFAMNVGVNPLQVDAMFNRIAEDDDSGIVSAIVYCDSFHARKFEMWMHPSPSFPLSAGAIAELKTLFRIP